MGKKPVNPIVETKTAKVFLLPGESSDIFQIEVFVFNEVVYAGNYRQNGNEPEEQMRRIRRRNGDAAARVFAERWIPFEERYIRAARVRERADLIVGETQ